METINGMILGLSVKIFIVLVIMFVALIALPMAAYYEGKGGDEVWKVVIKILVVALAVSAAALQFLK